MSDVKWSRRSTRRVARALCRRRVRISHSSVGRRLRKAGYSLRANRKRLAFKQSPHRDQQFRIIERLKQNFARTGDPQISVDSKKRELLGLFKNAGRAWCKEPRDVNAYDYPSEADGVAIPYGIFDMLKKEGFVVIGTSRNTPEFAVNAIYTWWRCRGRALYPRAKRLLITADAGGANGANFHVWKRALHELSIRIGLRIVVAHYPTGASKWNAVEHRLFGPISINWAGQPLVDLKTVCGFVRATRLEDGGRVRVRLDRRRWRTAQEQKKRGVPPKPPAPPGAVVPSTVLPKWNYTIMPTSRRRKRST